MFQPAPLALVLVLFGGTVARAQMVPAREQRQRTVTVTGNPDAPPHEVRVAPETPTMFLFGSEIRKRTVQVDATRIRVLDAGERSIIVQAMNSFGGGEREHLEVQFADGKAPERAVFVLVHHPSEVDTLLNVTRQEQHARAPDCQVALMELRARCSARGPLEFARSGYLDARGIKTGVVHKHRDESGGFESELGVSHLGKGWLLVDVVIRNLSGQPWVPQEATLTSMTGKQVTVRAMTVEPGEIGPGEGARILVEADAPPDNVGRDSVLRLRGMDGRIFTFPTLELSSGKEGKR